MLTHTDREIGRLIEVLERTGSLDNTIFVVMSDNGASQEGSQVGTLHQGQYFERAPMTIDQAIELSHEIGETQWFNNYPLGWAMAGNTPCKFYKQNTHGGGVRDPLVIHWPHGLAREPPPARFATSSTTSATSLRRCWRSPGSHRLAA